MDAVPLETGEAKFEEFLHGKRVVTFQLSFLLCQFNVFVDTISIGESTQKTKCHPFRILVWFMGVFASVKTGHKSSVPPRISKTQDEHQHQII